jgi:hypothetical protein
MWANINMAMREKHQVNESAGGMGIRRANIREKVEFLAHYQDPNLCPRGYHGEIAGSWRSAV